MLDRISDGRTDLVFEYLSQGHAATSTDASGVSLIKWCAWVRIGHLAQAPLPILGFFESSLGSVALHSR
jgi:hypothetical protein